MSIQSVMPSNHFILCRPLLLLPSIFPSIRVFSSESVLPAGAGNCAIGVSCTIGRAALRASSLHLTFKAQEGALSLVVNAECRSLSIRMCRALPGLDQEPSRGPSSKEVSRWGLLSPSVGKNQQPIASSPWDRK